MNKEIDQRLAGAFVCPKCHNRGGHVERLSMSGTGLSRLLEIQTYRYAFVSCTQCGYTEIYNLNTLEGRDNIGDLLEILFAD